MLRLSTYVLMTVMLISSCHVAALVPNFLMVGSARPLRVVPTKGYCGFRMALSYGDKTGQLSPESKGNPEDKTGVSAPLL